MKNHTVAVSSSEELILSDLERALITIRFECRQHENCDQCPLYDKGRGQCFIVGRDTYPEDWSLKCDDLLKENVVCVFKE